MKTKLHILFTLVLVIIFFVTCKKYPQDDPSLRLRTVSNRIHGTYVLEKYIVNDIDSTNLIPPCVAFNTLDYGKADGKYYFVFNKVGFIKGMDGDGLYGYGGAHKEVIYKGYNYNPGGGRSVLSPFKGNGGGWQILKLKRSEFYIKQTYSTFTTEVHLKKIHKI